MFDVRPCWYRMFQLGQWYFSLKQDALTGGCSTPLECLSLYNDGWSLYWSDKLEPGQYIGKPASLKRVTEQLQVIGIKKLRVMHYGYLPKIPKDFFCLAPRSSYQALITPRNRVWRFEVYPYQMIYIIWISNKKGFRARWSSMCLPDRVLSF